MSREPVQLGTRTMPVSCFAPELTDELLSKYSSVISSLPDGEVKDAMTECLKVVEVWWNLPESKGHPDDEKVKIVHRGTEVRVRLKSLTPDLQKELFDAIPWPYELEATQALFDKIDPGQKDLRDVAFHLLWYVKELCLDREPLTMDCLPT